MNILEREQFIDQLSGIASEVSDGKGRTVLISGEAGVGKTTLIKCFTDGLNSGTEVLWGACDDLFTPRPLGPIYDITYQVNSELKNKLATEGKRVVIFSEFLNYLTIRSGLKVLVIEDIHWADEATLDFIKFLARRINRTNTLLVLSYRNEEVGQDNILRSLLGDLPHSEMTRIRLYPLSEDAVDRMMKEAGIYDDKLFKRTGGNPFYVSEILADRSGELPLSVKEAVIKRISKLNSESKNLLEIISVVPTKTEMEILQKLFVKVEENLDKCINKGILVKDGNLVSFRHELARLAILSSLPELKKIRIHRKVLKYLLENERTKDLLARIVHHAIQAEDRQIITRYAPLAAKQASKLGAHSLAADHYQNALKNSDKLDPEMQLKLYEGRMYECYLTGQINEAIKAGQTIEELLLQYPDPHREAENYRRMSRILWYDCQDKKGEEYLDKAIMILEKLPLGWSLAMAYSNKSQTYANREESEGAIHWGQKALELAQILKDPEIKAHALNNMGTARMAAGDNSGENDLRNSLNISLRHNYSEHVVRAYINLGGMTLYQRKLDAADMYFTEGIEFTREKDLYVFELCLAGHHAKVKLHYGNWDEAIDLANFVLKKENVPPGNRLMPLSVLGTIRSRRNDPGAEELLDKSLELALKMGEMEKVVSVGSAIADHLWLQNKLNTFVDELRLIYEKVRKTNNPWAIGEIAYWLWKAGYLEEIPDKIAEPYYLQIKGRWKAAAEIWEELHCPYEQGLALSEGNEDSMKKAVGIFDTLGARAASQLIKLKMRERGIRKIPRGPRQSTTKNPAGLTNRQIDVLKLLAKGLSNSEIASRLYISPKTVDHHISAILTKLSLHSRTEAAAFVQSTKSIVSK